MANPTDKPSGRFKAGEPDTWQSFDASEVTEPDDAAAQLIETFATGPTLPPDLAAKLREGLTEEDLATLVRDDPRMRDWSNAITERFGKYTEGRFATTQQLSRLAKTARKNGWNQLLSDYDLARLDPDRFHIITPLIEHTFANGQDGTPHLRIRAMLAIRFREEPEERMLDLPINDVLKLPVVGMGRRRNTRTPPTWQQVLDLQREVLEAWRYSGNKVDTGTRSTDVIDHQSATLAVCPPYWVTSEMGDFIEASADSLGDWPYSPSDLLTPSGYVVLERPFWVHAPQGLMNISSIAWGRGNANLPTGGMTPSVLLVAYSDRFLSADETWNTEQAAQFDAVRWPRMTPAGVSTWLLHEAASEVSAGLAELDPLNDYIDPQWSEALGAIRRWLAAFWLISASRIASLTSAAPPRAERRRAARLDLPTEVRLVTLRRSASSNLDVGDGEGPRRQYSHRFPVRAHWRRIWSDKEQRVKTIPVQAYIKGPVDKPFIAKKNVYLVKR